MDKAWATIAAATVGLLAIALLVRHFQGVEPAEPAPAARTTTPLRTPAEHGGWVAKSGVDEFGRSIAAPRASRHSGAASPDTAESASEPIEPGATAPQAKGRTIIAPAVPADVQAAPTGGATSQSATTAPSNDAQAEDAGPVLSLPFDRSTDPDKGDMAPIVAEGVTFDSEGARFATDAQFIIPNAGNINGSAGTITFWLRPEWAGDPDSNASLVQLRTNTFENRLQIFKNGPYLRFLFADNTGVESGVGVGITEWQAGELHMVTATWGDGVTSLYIDGQWKGDKEYNGELQIGPDTPLYIGSDHRGGGPGARSTITNFQIFNRALTADEVAGLAARAPR